jgi:hypothetical protein
MLGCIISSKGRRIDPEKIETVLHMADCTNESELKSFLGIVNYFSPYIEGFTDDAAPLYRLLCKDVPFLLTPYLSKVQFFWKMLLAQALTLTSVTPKKPYVVYTDVSIKALSAVLFQRDDGGILRPIWFAIRLLLPA